ncbi:MAG: MEDS domain-containing protein [Nitrososphaerales archaeon]
MNNIAYLKRISEVLASLTSDPEERSYSTVIGTLEQQLLLMKGSDSSILRFGTSGVDSKTAHESGLDLIENLVAKFDDFRHFVLLYDDHRSARNVEFRYLEKGLQRGERCLYVISGDDVETAESIRLKMDSFGIDTSRYLNNGLLVITSIPDIGKEIYGFKSNCKLVLDKLIGDSGSLPVRMVIHARYQLSSEEEINDHSELEKIVEYMSSHFRGSILCNHYVGKYNSKKYGEWTRNIVQSHGVVLMICAENNIPVFLRDNSDMPEFYHHSSFFSVADEEDIYNELGDELRHQSPSDVERDIAELKNDLDFLVAQLRADLNYTPSELQEAIAKIVRLKRKVEAMSDSLNKN